MTILEEVPAELAPIAASLHASAALAGFTMARGTMRVEVTLAAPGRMRIRVERPELFVAPPKPRRERTDAPYRAAGQAPAMTVIDPILPVELGLETDASAGPDGLRVETQLEEAASLHILTPEVRRRAVELLGKGYERVFMLRDGPAVEAERDIEEGLPADGEMVRSGIDALAEIASALPVIATPTAWRRAERRDWSWLWFALPPVLLVTMVVQFAKYSFLNPIANFAGLLAGAGLGLTLGPIVAVLQMRKGRTGSAAAAAFLVVLLTLPLALENGLVFVNSTLDSSPAVPWHAKVVRLQTRQGDNQTFYSAVLERRSPKEQPIRLDIEEAMYKELQGRPEDRRVLVLDIHRGGLDLNWYTRIQLLP